MLIILVYHPGLILLMIVLTGGRCYQDFAINGTHAYFTAVQDALLSDTLLKPCMHCSLNQLYLIAPQYRTTVARMLRKQANEPRNPAQFIITTFHPQVRPH